MCCDATNRWSYMSVHTNCFVKRSLGRHSQTRSNMNVPCSHKKIDFLSFFPAGLLIWSDWRLKPAQKFKSFQRTWFYNIHYWLSLRLWIRGWYRLSARVEACKLLLSCWSQMSQSSTDDGVCVCFTYLTGKKILLDFCLRFRRDAKCTDSFK